MPDRDGMTHICVACRTLLAADESCEPGHAIVPIGSRAHRDAVWHGATEVRASRNSDVSAFFRGVLTYAGIGIAVTVLACLPFTLCTDHPVDAARSSNFWISVAVVSAIVVPALVYEQVDLVSPLDILRYPFPPARRLQPRGVPPLAPPSIEGPEGVARGEPTLTSPLSQRACLAWHVELEYEGHVFARASAAVAFSVVLNDGTHARLSDGRIDLFASTPSDATLLAIGSWLESIAPSHGAGDRSPFPWDRAREVIVRPDDRIVLLGELRRQPAPTADEGATYREAAATELVPIGRPAMRVEA